MKDEIVKRNIKPHWLTTEEIKKLGKAHNKPVHGCPVMKYKDKWYFWDETWSGCFGPFRSISKVKEAVAEYVKTI